MRTLFLTLFALISISSQVKAQCDFNPPVNSPVSTGSFCSSRDFYTPYNPSHTPIKYVKINIHIFRDDNGNENFSEAEGVQFVNDMLNMSSWGANWVLSNLSNMNLPPNNNTVNVGDARYRYVLHPDINDPNDPDHDGIYFHNTSSNYYNAPNYHDPQTNSTVYGPNFQPGNFDALYTPFRNTNALDVINVYMPAYHNAYRAYQISQNDYTRTGGWAGTIYSNIVVLCGAYERFKNMDNHPVQGPLPPQGYFYGWHYAFAIKEYANLLNHEAGHALGLHHSWVYNDDDGEGDCSDSPFHGNSPSSNNMMDYNSAMNALTPCQIGVIHRNLANHSFLKTTVLEDYCVSDPNFPIDILQGQDIVWNASRNLKGDVIVRNGGKLTISCKIGMPQGAKILVEKGAKLTLVDAHLTANCDNTLWDGIIVEANPLFAQSIDNLSGLYPEHGWLVVNNSTIEHAYMGISAGYSTPGTNGVSGGAFITVNNSKFLNNRFSVRFYEYGFQNKSKINDTRFECSGPLPGFPNNDGSYSFVSLFGVKNIWLSGNTYINTAPGGLNNPFGSKFRGAGIISVNSTYWVTPSYMNTSSNGTCVFPIAGAGRSVFKGLTHGVYIYNQNNDPTRQAHILEADFEDVSMGIGMNWDTKTQAYGNHFTWTANFDQYPYFSHPNVAVKTDFAEGSSIDRNEMNFSYQDPSSTGFHGVSVFMSNPGLYPIGDPNLLPFNVYKNNILSGNGNLAGEVGLHIDGSHNNGLQFQCNEFSGLGNAVISQVGNNIPPQGSSNMAAGNKFNDPCVNNNRLYSPAPTNPTDYFYSSTSNEEVASFQCSNWNNIFSPNTNPCPENSRLGYYCPEGEGGDGTGEIGENEQHIRNHTDEFTDALRLIQAGAYSSAQALLQQISNEQEHGLVSLSLDVYQGGSSYFTLSPAQKQTLDQLFETGNVKVKQSIRSISLAFTQEPVQETPPVAVTATMLAKREAATVKVTDAGEYKLFPNPAHQHVNLTYRLPSNSTKATIRVQDVFGQVVWQQVVTSHSGQVEINLPQKTGIFFCTIENNERTLFKAKVLLTK